MIHCTAKQIVRQNTRKIQQTTLYNGRKRLVPPISVPTIKTTSESEKHLVKNTLQIAIPLAVGLISSNVLPTMIPQLFTDMFFAGVATYVAQPLVNTKLASQTEHRPPIETTSALKRPFLFLIEDSKSFAKNFVRVMQEEGASNGVMAYAGRNSVGKALTLFGYNAILPLVDQYCAVLPDTGKSMLAGLISGAIQSPLTGPLEWSSSLHSKNPTMTYKQQAQYMTNCFKQGVHLPITTVGARSGAFDSVFNTLQHEYGISFGVSSLVATTVSYPAEIKRAEVQTRVDLDDPKKEEQDKKDTRSDNSEKKHDKNVFQGWISRSIEGFFIYSLFQYFRNQHNEQKKDVKKM